MPATQKQVETHIANKQLRVLLARLSEGPESPTAQKAVDELWLHCLSSGRIRQTLKAAGGVPPLQAMRSSMKVTMKQGTHGVACAARPSEGVGVLTRGCEPV